MKISELLLELKISFEELKTYEAEVGYVLLLPDQVLSDKIINKIKLIHSKSSNHSLKHQKFSDTKISSDSVDLSKFKKPTRGGENRLPIKTKISSTKERRLQFLKGLYYNKTHYKLEVKVKWYYNHARELNEGYLVCNGLPDIHFKGEVVKGINPRALRENDEVLVEIPLRDLESRTKLSASKVNKLEDEDDLGFLVYQSISAGNKTYFNQALEQIKIQSEGLIKETKQEIQAIIKSYIKDKISSIAQAIFLYEFCELASINLLSDITNKVKESFNLNDQFKLWLGTSAKFSFNYFKDTIVNYLLQTNTHEFLNKLKPSDITVVLKEALTIRLTSNDNSKSSNLTSLLNSIKTHGIEIDYSIFNDQQLFLFWSNNTLDFSPIDAIYKKIVELWFEDSETALDQILSIFDRATEQELKDLFSKTHYNKDLVRNEKEFELIRVFLDHIESKELTEEFFKTIYSKSPEYIKLKWFILDYTNQLDYHDAIIYTGILSSQNQKLFFKKVLMLIETKQLNLSVNDLNKITTIDYKTSEYAKEIDGVGLDFTLSIILKIITDLSQSVVTSKKTIFNIIANQIKRPNDLLVISGFFSTCTGRTVLEEQTQANTDYDEPEQERVVTYSLKKTERTPRFSNYCDGRKSVDNNGNPILDRKGKKEFWWCENSPCFETCRKPVNAVNWKNYTLQDVLRILNISYSEKQYEITLSIINRVNRFLEHLTCNHCRSILRPNGRGNYGFYGVSMFSCCNEDCDNPDKDIYLSHCLNGRCEDIIDSRTTVKCKPSSIAHSDNCGWYICNNCHACCSSEKLLTRKNNLEYNGQDYNCHIDGHRDLGIICCTKCGTETQEVGINETLYQTQLQWFLDHRNATSIVASGQRNDGKWWFRWSRENLSFERFIDALQNLRDNGFQVPDLETGNDIQFIAEPFFNVSNQEPNKFMCPECNFIVELSDADEFDFARINTIKQFHNVVFPNFRTQE